MIVSYDKENQISRIDKKDIYLGNLRFQFYDDKTIDFYGYDASNNLFKIFESEGKYCINSIIKTSTIRSYSKDKITAKLLQDSGLADIVPYLDDQSKQELIEKYPELKTAKKTIKPLLFDQKIKKIEHQIQKNNIFKDIFYENGEKETVIYKKIDRQDPKIIGSRYYFIDGSHLDKDFYFNLDSSILENFKYINSSKKIIYENSRQLSKIECEKTYLDKNILIDLKYKEDKKYTETFIGENREITRYKDKKGNYIDCFNPKDIKDQYKTLHENIFRIHQFFDKEGAISNPDGTLKIEYFDKNGKQVKL